VLSSYFGLGNMLAATVLLSALTCRAQSPPPGPVLDPYPPDSPGASHASLDLRVRGSNSGGWLFPVTELDRSLPSWLQFGAEFRDRVEGQVGLRYAPTDDIYNLTQLRIGAYIQPTNWFRVVAVTQDSRVFFNQHVPNAPSYQNVWDLREAYAKIGNADSGWITATVGRQVLSFGDERVIGPSDWSNMGRSFDIARVDLNANGLQVAVFATSVIAARDGVIDHHIQGNNLYGVYALEQARSARNIGAISVLESGSRGPAPLGEWRWIGRS